METPQVNRKQIDDLRAWFFAKDRSVSLAQNALYYLFAGGRANGAYMSMAFIAETILSASVTSTTFSTIPQNFRTLQIVSMVRSDAVAEIDALRFRFNGDSGVSYDFSQLLSSGAAALGAPSRGVTSGFLGLTEGASSRAATFAASVAWLPCYTIPTIEKRTLSITASFGDLSADGDLSIRVVGSHWRNTNVITSITILPATGPNFVTGSRFQLYGIL